MGHDDNFDTNDDIKMEPESSRSDTVQATVKKRRGRKPKARLPIQCSEERCKMSFNFEKEYEIHALEHTFPCNNPTCIKRFKSVEDLEVHERKHQRGVKSFFCGECDKSFNGKNDLTLHLRKHTGEKPFPCELCGKCFSRKAQRKIHMVVHTKEKKFLCPECKNCFGSMSTLIDHKKRVHIGIRQHKCEQCVKAFFNRKELEAHERTHTGEKPFLCLVCYTAFPRNHHLKRHMDSVHKAKNVVIEKKEIVEVSEKRTLHKNSNLFGENLSQDLKDEIMQKETGSTSFKIVPSCIQNPEQPQQYLAIYCILNHQVKDTPSQLKYNFT